jgi:diguanylate cyclase (GGDEF)-like protein
VIDIQTLLLVLGLGNFCFAALMAVYTDGAVRHPGLRLWMWARLVMGACQLLAWAHQLNTLPWSAHLEPIGWVGGLALETAAYCVFFDVGRWKRVLFPVTCIAMLLMMSAGSADASRDVMTVLVASIIGLFAAVMAFVLMSHTGLGSSRLQKIIGINDLMFALAMGALAWSGIGHGGVNLMQPGAPQVTAVLCGYLVMIVNGFGFLLMCKQKDDSQMEWLATTDSLTGLANRRAFLERAESARMLAARLRKPITLLMLDIDHFKQINDRFGHATGDEALLVFADTARQVLREHDIMGRLGGEEFALVLPGTDFDGALHAAERLRVAVSEAPLITSGNAYAMTVSIGVVLIDPNEALTTALARADHALYAAKSGGRNRVEAGAPTPMRA